MPIRPTAGGRSTREHCSGPRSAPAAHSTRAQGCSNQPGPPSPRYRAAATRRAARSSALPGCANSRQTGSSGAISGSNATHSPRHVAKHGRLRIPTNGATSDHRSNQAARGRARCRRWRCRCSSAPHRLQQDDMRPNRVAVPALLVTVNVGCRVEHELGVGILGEQAQHAVHRLAAGARPVLLEPGLVAEMGCGVEVEVADPAAIQPELGEERGKVEDGRLPWPAGGPRGLHGPLHSAAASRAEGVRITMHHACGCYRT